jgi:CBS-domain-containing membrane protein
MKLNLLAGLTSSLAIFILGFLGQLTNHPMLIAPFGASCVLLFGAPESPFVKPRNLICGHLLSAVVGLIFLNYTSGSLIMMSIATGVAVSLMLITKTAHPAAGANPLLIMVTHARWSFVIFPILSGVTVLVMIGFGYRRLRSNSFLLKKPFNRMR